jgi:hypothetical protein
MQGKDFSFCQIRRINLYSLRIVLINSILKFTLCMQEIMFYGHNLTDVGNSLTDLNTTGCISQFDAGYNLCSFMLFLPYGNDRRTTCFMKYQLPLTRQILKVAFIINSNVKITRSKIKVTMERSCQSNTYGKYWRNTILKRWQTDRQVKTIYPQYIFRCKTNTLPILMHQMRISTTWKSLQ